MCGTVPSYLVLLDFFKICFYGYKCFTYEHPCMQYLQRPEEGSESLRSGVMDNCKLPCGYWVLSLGPNQ